MSIELEAFGALLPPDQRRQILQCPAGATVRQVADRLGLSPESIGLITIGGVQSELEDIVPPGCRLCFFPPLSGG